VDGQGMRTRRHLQGFLMLFLLTPAVLAARQDTPADEPDDAGAANRSQEVEVSEDNYRRFMELKERPYEHAPLPIEAYDPQAELEKMGKLPEESQKHLRNQLREIILQGEAWQPGDENKDYPYVPSADARRDATLQREENEAWVELVGKYHEREAAIYAGTRQASASAMGATGERTTRQGAQAAANQASLEGQAGQSGERGTPQGAQAAANQASREGQAGADNAQHADEAGSEQAQQHERALRAALSMPDAAAPPAKSRSAVPERGLTENALEHLAGKGPEAPAPGAVGEGYEPASGDPECAEPADDGESPCETVSAERDTDR